MTESLRFGRAEVRPRERQLLVEGVAAGVGARAFDVLLTLIERRDRLVTKSELLDLVWPGMVVEENNLQVQISALRKLLGPKTIATVPGRGYQFTAALDGEAEPRTEAAPHSSIQSRATARRTNLPVELPVLYGRDDDLLALRSLMAEHRLVTIVGAGGIGKSRVAQAVAHASVEQWPDGVWMVELAGLSEPALLPNAIAGALDFEIVGKDTALEELVAGLVPRTTLLVLDNCEHLLDAVVRSVEVVLRAAPGVTLLATSQEPLRTPDEQQFRVGPLAVPQETEARGAREFGAVALLEARVRAVDPGFALNEENAKLAIEICRRLDGLPLAIELAAARVPALGLRGVRDKLDARFKLLTGGARAALRRHQTLRAALEWSHGLLNDEERVVLRRLGVFAGGFTMELAQAVAGDEQLDEWSVLDHMSALVDKSLVVAEPGEPPRYRLLESARAFALERLAEGETGDALRRHAKAMLNFMQRVDGANLDGELRTDQYAALAVPELDNLRAAHAWSSSEEGEAQVAIALASHSGSMIDYAVECADWLLPHRQQVEEGAVDGSLDEAVVARYWRAIAAANMMGRAPHQLQVEAAERARAMYKALGQPRRVFSSLMRLVSYRLFEGDQVSAQTALAEARSLIQPDWPAEFHMHLLRRETSTARAAGKPVEALAFERQEVQLSVAAGDWRLQVIARNNLVDLLWEVGPIEEAAREARQLAQELRARPVPASADILFANLMGILSEMGLVAEASDVAREALPIMRRTQNYYLDEWVFLFWRRGQADVAARLLGALDASSRKTGLPTQHNERRLIAKARSALEKELPPDVLARHLASDAALTPEKLPELLSESLALRVQPPHPTR